MWQGYTAPSNRPDTVMLAYHKPLVVGHEYMRALQTGLPHQQEGHDHALHLTIVQGLTQDAADQS